MTEWQNEKDNVEEDIADINSEIESINNRLENEIPDEIDDLDESEIGTDSYDKKLEELVDEKQQLIEKSESLSEILWDKHEKLNFIEDEIEDEDVDFDENDDD